MASAIPYAVGGLGTLLATSILGRRSASVPAAPPVPPVSSTPSAPPPAPTEQTGGAAVDAANETAKKGRQATIATGPGGILGTEGTRQGRSLMGGGLIR